MWELHSVQCSLRKEKTVYVVYSVTGCGLLEGECEYQNNWRVRFCIS